MADYMSDRGKSAGSLRLTPSGDDGDAPPVLVEQRSPGRRLRCCACGRACAPDEFDDAERGRVPDDRMCRRCAKMGARHGDSSGAPLPSACANSIACSAVPLPSSSTATGGAAAPTTAARHFGSQSRSFATSGAALRYSLRIPARKVSPAGADAIRPCVG